MSQARKFVAAYTTLVTGDLVAKLLSFLAMALLARRLGAGLFGEIAFAGALASYFILIVGQGLDIYGVREAARSPSEATRLAGSILGLRLVSSLVAAVLWIVAVTVLDRPPGLGLFFALYGLNLVSAAFSLGWFFQARQETRPVAVSAIVSQLFFATGIALWVRTESQLALVPVLQFGGDVLAYLHLLYRFRAYGPMRPTFGASVWTPILRASIPMGLSGALGLVMLNFDTVLLGFMRSRAEVGEYGAAYKVVLFFYALLFLFSSNLLQLFSRSQNSNAVLARLAGQFLRYTLLLAIPLAAGGTVAARPLMTMVFGREFAAGAAPLQVLIWTIPMLTARMILRNAMLARDMQKLILRRAAIGASLNAGLNLVLIPRFGYVGAAATTLLAEAVLLVIFYREVSGRITRIPLLPHVWRPLLASVPMVAAVQLLPELHLLVRIAIGVVVYLAGARLAGAFRFREVGEVLGLRAAGFASAGGEGPDVPEDSRDLAGRG
jgi:O-antigen/teichoic acid export membrane protein